VFTACGIMQRRSWLQAAFSVHYVKTLLKPTYKIILFYVLLSNLKRYLSSYSDAGNGSYRILRAFLIFSVVMLVEKKEVS